MMKICKICGVSKSLDNFQSNGFSSSGSKKYKPNCSPCTNKLRLNDKRIKVEQILIDSARKIECELCGYNKNWAALHFHHLDPKEKEFEVSQIRSSVSYSKLKSEIDKCILLCANCHAEEHSPHQTIIVDER